MKAHFWVENASLGSHLQSNIQHGTEINILVGGNRRGLSIPELWLNNTNTAKMLLRLVTTSTNQCCKHYLSSYIIHKTRYWRVQEHTAKLQRANWKPPEQQQHQRFLHLRKKKKLQPNNTYIHIALSMSVIDFNHNKHTKRIKGLTLKVGLKAATAGLLSNLWNVKKWGFEEEAKLRNGYLCLVKRVKDLVLVLWNGEIEEGFFCESKLSRGGTVE